MPTLSGVGMSDARSDDQRWMERMQRHRLRGLTEMAAGMAHEINQPLSGIRGFAEGILIGLEEGWEISTAEIINKMGRIIHEADRIDDLIQGVRGFADESEREDMLSVDPAAVVQAACRLLGARIQAHGNALVVHRSASSEQNECSEQKALVRANPFALQEALQAIILNAAEACNKQHPQGGGRITISMEYPSSEDDPLSIVVTDNGCGMTNDELQRLGEPFFTTQPGQHVGLGVATARGILSQCGGRLQYHSEAGHGCTATIALYHRLSPSDQV